MMLKLVLLGYSYGLVSYRKIARFARENVAAMWLVQEHRPTCRTIARFVLSTDLEPMIQASLKKLYDYI
ncbi:hypothetical protein FC35_GL000015 [Limosilactobacillus coleohominis DSM 14060]|nr:hypothetical protein FC35_GL000015 [Limosilactobacillus coleohominis DSM 14060]